MLLNTPDGPLYFEISGDGPPLVFISGWAMSCECWRPVVSVLKQDYRCLIYDHRGIARSQPADLDAEFTIEDHAEDLHSILNETRIFDASFVAHDLGVMISAALERRHPQDINSLIAVSPGPSLPADDIKTLGVLTPASLALRELAAYPLIRSLVQRRFRRAPKVYRDRLYTDFAQLSPRAAYETALAASSSENTEIVSELVQGDRLRVLLVCGDKDKRSLMEARRLFATARTAKLATMKDCGFLPMLEYPLQLAKLIDQFVKHTSPSKRRSSLEIR
ncbi:MAG TPA: alpha/beta hydrolase [Blastocatellia bacterium]|nr:alpha/beta hydrolase [Blastocatellia bacterium]